jgi:hypothetical protein
MFLHIGFYFVHRTSYDHLLDAQSLNPGKQVSQNQLNLTYPYLPRLNYLIEI